MLGLGLGLGWVKVRARVRVRVCMSIHMLRCIIFACSVMSVCLLPVCMYASQDHDALALAHVQPPPASSSSSSSWMSAIVMCKAHYHTLIHISEHIHTLYLASLCISIDVKHYTGEAQ